MMSEIFFSCVLFGGFAGLLAGVFGIGGGVVLVPFFVWLFQRYGFAENNIMLIAVATSLATILLTSIASLLAHHRAGAVLWGDVLSLVPGLLLGAIFGAVLADFLPQDLLRKIFAFFLLYVAYRMAWQISTKPGSLNKSGHFYSLSGVFIGFLSAILGIGGGTLTVPLMVKSGTTMGHAVAVSSACGLPIALVGSLSYAYLGWDKITVSTGFLGYVYLPAFLGIICTSVLTAPLGAKLTHNLPTQQLKRYFSGLLFVVAIKLLHII